MTADPYAGARQFFAELAADNTREFWARERQRYDDGIRPAFVDLCERLEELGPWRVYRPHNDTRFGGREPYKTFVGAVAERPDGVGAFVQLSAAGLLVGTGMPMPAKDQLPRLRQAIAEEPSGTEFLAAVAATRAAGAEVHGGRWPPLARVPAGFPADHPRAEHLRWKGVEASVRLREPVWGGADAEAERVRALLHRSDPLLDWLGAHVGPSALTAEERFAPRRRG